MGNALPPASRRSINRLLKKFREKGTLEDLRKRRPSCQEGKERVCNKAMVDQVRAVLDVESARKADEVGSSGRRNPFNKDKAQACVDVGGGVFEGRKL